MSGWTQAFVVALLYGIANQLYDIGVACFRIAKALEKTP
jgi:hypothetical protein